MSDTVLTAKIKENGLTAVILIAAVVISWKVYQGKEKEIQAIMSQKAVEEEKNAVLDQIGMREKKLEKLKKDINNKEPTTGMDRIGDLAKSVPVQISKINPLKEIVSGVYTRYPYELTLSAKDYHQIGKFISLLENSPDTYMVEDLVIHNNVSGDPNSMSASLMVYTIMINQ